MLVYVRPSNEAHSYRARSGSTGRTWLPFLPHPLSDKVSPHTSIMRSQWPL